MANRWMVGAHEAMNGRAQPARSFPHMPFIEGYSWQASKAGTKKPPGWGGLFVFRWPGWGQQKWY